MKAGRATPPISFAGGAAAALEHFEGPRVDVGEERLAQLRAVCADVDTSPATTAEAGRDWWPLTLRWALAGATPARPAAVARPASVAEAAAVVALCAESGIPLTAAGGRSGVCGGSVPVYGGVALDTCGLVGIVAVDNDVAPRRRRRRHLRPGSRTRVAKRPRADDRSLAPVDRPCDRRRMDRLPGRRSVLHPLRQDRGHRRRPRSDPAERGGHPDRGDGRGRTAIGDGPGPDAAVRR